MITFAELHDLSECIGQNIENLKQLAYSDLEVMIQNRKTEKRRIRTKEYEEIIRTYLEPYKFLRQWWSDDEIMDACIKRVDIDDIIMEYKVRQGQGCPYKPAQFLTTRMDYLPRYTKKGERLMEPEYTRCDIYWVKHQYQANHNGKIVAELLYHKYPQLKEFEFEIYGYQMGEKDNEIYPKNHIYTPLQALMEKDIGAIKNRNIEYAKSYNNGIYTPALTKERLESEEAKHFFDVIRNL